MLTRTWTFTGKWRDPPWGLDAKGPCPNSRLGDPVDGGLVVSPGRFLTLTELNWTVVEFDPTLKRRTSHHDHPTPVGALRVVALPFRRLPPLRGQMSYKFTADTVKQFTI